MQRKMRGVSTKGPLTLKSGLLNNKISTVKHSTCQIALPTGLANSADSVVQDFIKTASQ